MRSSGTLRTKLLFNMPELKRRSINEHISKTRAAKASVLTGMTVTCFLLLCYHFWWSFGAFYERKFGSASVTLVILLAGFALNIYVTIKVLLFFETRLLSNSIDADHKKYI